MSDLDTIKAKLIKAKKAKSWPTIEVVSGVSQRTMYNIVQGKMPSYSTMQHLKNYFHSCKEKK
jgi:hypothetical protein